VLRLQVPIVTDPGVEFYVNGRRVPLQPGEAWVLDTSYRHRVEAVKQEGQNKEAIDAIFNHREPDYLMILGAPDVVPHQRLINTLKDDDDDDGVDGRRHQDTQEYRIEERA
jgi:Aspartyl/Asparaginyl beta-hydroxylase